MSLFKGVSNIGDSLLSQELENNLIALTDWSMLAIGAFVNVRIPTSGAYGGIAHKLRLSEDPNYSKGQVWEGFRSNWIYESGVPGPTQPIAISGIYVNNAFIPANTSGPFSYHVNYPLGRVIFNTAIAANSVVTAEYSYRFYNVSTADTSWYRDVMFNSLRIDDPQFMAYASGQWSTSSTNRIQLPAVIVQALPKRTQIPFELGGGFRIRTDIDFEIFTETSFDRKQIMDILTYQDQLTFDMFNTNNIIAAQSMPLDFEGNLAVSGQIYPQLLQNFPWRKATVMGAALINKNDYLPLFCGTARLTVEVDMPEV